MTATVTSPSQEAARRVASVTGPWVSAVAVPDSTDPSAVRVARSTTVALWATTGSVLLAGWCAPVVTRSTRPSWRR